jgi:predicted aldo/keto reductase-like oxidoreductase
MRRYIDESCQRMGVDYIHNLYIHGINNYELLEMSVRKGGCLDGIRRAM